MDDLEREVERLRGWVRWAAEVTLATVEYEQGLSRPRKHEVRRQNNVAQRLLMAQRGGEPDRGTPRVDEIERMCRPHAPEGDGR